MSVSDDALILGFEVVETLKDEHGGPLNRQDAVDAEGKLHHDIIKRLAISTEVRIAFDRVQISRYMTAGELRKVAKDLDDR